MSTRPLLVLDLKQPQQDPRMPQELFYSRFQQAPPECATPAKFKKHRRIKRHYLFKQAAVQLLFPVWLQFLLPVWVEILFLVSLNWTFFYS